MTVEEIENNLSFNIQCDECEKVSGIYLIKNKHTKMFYIGRSDNVFGCSGRFSEHKNRLRNNNHDNDFLQNVWNKDGEDSFEFVLIERIDDPIKLKEREQMYLDYLRPIRRSRCYNLSFSAAGGGGMLSKHHSIESKLRISNSLKGRISPNKGKKASKQKLEKMKKAFGGEKNPRYKKIDPDLKLKFFLFWKKYGSMALYKESLKFGYKSCPTARFIREFKENPPAHESFTGVKL